MMGHKICFYGEIWLIIPKLSLLPLLICSTVFSDNTINMAVYYETYFIRNEKTYFLSNEYHELITELCQAKYMLSLSASSKDAN